MASALAFAAVGAYGYADNIIHTGTLLGVNSETAAMQPVRTGPRHRLDLRARALEIVDLSGLGEPQSTPSNAIDNAGRAVFGMLDRTNPREATLAPFSFVPNTYADETPRTSGRSGPCSSCLPLRFSCSRVLRAARAAERFLVALALPLYVVVFALAYRYNAWPAG